VQLAAEEVLPAATENDMGIVIATPLAGGIYVEREQQQAVEQRFEGVEERAAAWSVIDSLRQESSSLPQSAFRWILADERVATVSSGASNVSELEEVVEAGIMEPLAHQ
jgi:aryl-alcohol dehydrogenase-like predicted oxidoreductase